MLKKSYPLLATVFLFFLLYFISLQVPKENIHSVLGRAGFWGPVIYVFLAFLTNVIAPLSATPLIFAGFYVFGSNVVFLMVIADFFASITNFWIARRWGRLLVKKFVGKDNIKRIDKFTQDYGLLTLLFLRIFQGGVADFVSYAAGLTSMQFIPYFIISIAGMIPRTALWYFVSIQTTNPLIFISLTYLIIIVFSGVFLIGLSVRNKWFREKR